MRVATRFGGLLCALVILLVPGCHEDAHSPTAPADDSEDISTSVNAPPSRDSLRSVFIRYKPSAPASRLAIVRGHGARFAQDLSRTRWLAIELPPSAVQAIASLPWVEAVETDSSTAFLTGDTYPWGIDSSGARAVHAYARGTGVKIAFLDGGVRCTLIDLNQRIAGGYDWINETSTYCQNQDITGGVEHGTSVAQVLAASLNDLNLVGMAPEASLYSLRVCHEVFGCSTARIAAALEWSLSHGIQVVSASIGNCGESLPTAVREAMAALYRANVVQAWAGGNGVEDCGDTEKISSFLIQPGVIGVTGYVATAPGYLQNFAHNQYLDIAAPTNVQRLSIFGGPYICCFGGTSAATPHVAGAAALLIGLGFSGADLIAQRLTSTAEDRDAPGRDNFFGYGVLNAGVAAARRPIASALTGVPVPVKSEGTYWLAASITQGAGPFAVSWTVHYSNGVLPDTATGFSTTPLALQVPPGSYTITVRATPKESTYLRVGTTSQFDIPVCTGGGGGGDLSARPALGAGPPLAGRIVPGDPTPNAVGGC